MPSHAPSSRSSRTRALLATTVVGIGSVLAVTGATSYAGVQPLPREYVVGPNGAAGANAVRDGSLPANDKAKGLVYDGYTRGGSDGPCAGLLEATTRGQAKQCSHGPDPAPDGVDVAAPRSVEDLTLATIRATALANGSGGGGQTAPAQAVTMPCYGDGVSGNRIQAIYARASDKPDRYSTLAPMFSQWATITDSAYNDSAAKTGGIRHLRWVTDASCNLNVIRATLSPTGDDNMSNMELELQSLGLDRNDRKYMVWMDANVYCGIGDIRFDDQPGVGNANNYGTSWARVDSGCWGMSNSAEAHELMHTLGGVQPSAPHASYAWHCTDESDAMCYSDGPGVTMTYPCPLADERLFDCGNDDYFNTAPAPTSYLATHWNAAMNIFLETTGPSGTTTTTTTPTTTTTVPSGGGTTTNSWTGSFKGNVLSKSYSVNSGAGTIVTSATYSGGGATVTLTVKNAGGAVIGQQSGPSGVSLSIPVSAGAYSVTISGSKNMSYTVVVASPAP